MDTHSSLYLWSVIIVMALVNYPLRVLPATLISKVHFGRFMKRVLYLIPYTALTALVFPGIFFSLGEHYAIAVVGTIVAILSSVFKLPLSLTVILAVLAVLVLLIIC